MPSGAVGGRTVDNGSGEETEPLRELMWQGQNDHHGCSPPGKTGQAICCVARPRRSWLYAAGMAWHPTCGNSVATRPHAKNSRKMTMVTWLTLALPPRCETKGQARYRAESTAARPRAEAAKQQ